MGVWKTRCGRGRIECSGFKLSPKHVDAARVQPPPRRGRFITALTLLFSVLIITSCGSTTPTSDGLTLPTSCSSTMACLNIAKVDGHLEHVLTPGGDVLSAGKS